MPSLIINLLTNSEGGFESKKIFKKFDKILRCDGNNNNNNQPQDVDFENDPFLFNRTANCTFPGSAVFQLMKLHSETIERVNEYFHNITIKNAWLTDYNLRSVFKYL
jgi:hypothetical protein